jgi:mutual gliding-motility protein MglA
VVVVSYSGKEINAKLVYYGAGLSGKTTNLEAIYEAVPETSRGKMVSMKTQSDRTLFFDLLPLDLGEIMGFKTRFLLYTVPGQVFYNATRKLVLKGADGIVFVADSGIGKMDENRESLQNLSTNLSEYGLRLDEIPWVLQYNKRDLPNVYSIDELNAELNPTGKVPFFEAVAKEGGGVFETFRGISHLLMQKVTRELHRSSNANRGSRGDAARASAAAATENRSAPVAEPPTPRTPAPAQTPEPAGAADWTVSTPPGLERETAAPIAPARAMSSEAREAEDGALEFGDLALQPGNPSLGITHEENVPASSSSQVAPLELEREPTVEVVRARVQSAQAAAADAPRSRVGFEERTIHFQDGPPAARSGGAATSSTATAAGTSREIVIPITIPAGATREIVLRISIQADGSAS